MSREQPLAPYSPTVRRLVTVALILFIVELAVSLKAAHCADVTRPAALYLSLAAADLGSTAYALDNGMAETNPLMRSYALPKQVASAALLTFADVKLQKAGRPGRARALRIAVTVIRVGVVAINVRNARRGR